MSSTVLPDIEGFDSSQLQQILNDLDSQTVKAGKAKLPPISFSSEDERLKLEQGLHKASLASGNMVDSEGLFTQNNDL